MTEPNEGNSVAHDEARQALRIERRRLSSRLCTDRSFAAVDAMSQMAAVTESYVRTLGLSSTDQAVWLAGSLGRQEMLPNSDLDLFVITDGHGDQNSAAPTIPADGFDMFELGVERLGNVRAVLCTHSIDANPYIDGRALDPGPIGREVGELVKAIGTYDRQVANFVSEYGYYHYFDFNWKRTTYGANLKYSSGSARVTLFFNFYNRILTGRFPAVRGQSPEFLDGLDASESRLGRPMPRREIDLIQVVKNTAISAYYKRGDRRLRYVSRHSLDTIFEICKPRFSNMGICDAQHFSETYYRARRAVEAGVVDLFGSVMACHPLAGVFAELGSTPPDAVADCSAIIADSNPGHKAAVLAVAAWSCVAQRPPSRVIKRLATSILDHGLEAGWGGIMAVACAPTADEDVFMGLLDWLELHERGAYLTKLIARNPTAAATVRRRATDSYRQRERVRQYGQTGLPLAEPGSFVGRAAAYEA